MEQTRKSREEKTADRAYDREEGVLIGLVILLAITVILLGLAWLLVR